MKWIKQVSGYWLAQGKNGNFLIWQEQKNWHGRYLSTDGLQLLVFPNKSNFQEMLVACEKSKYWEYAV